MATITNLQLPDSPLSEQDLLKAEQRMQKRAQTTPFAVAARYDAITHRLQITLDSGIELAVPCALVQGLEQAVPQDFDALDLSPTGLGLHVPNLDADVYIPALLQGILGDRRWMAQQLGRKGGGTVSAAKSAAARANGKLGGRPRQKKSGDKAAP